MSDICSRVMTRLNSVMQQPILSVNIDQTKPILLGRCHLLNTIHPNVKANYNILCSDNILWSTKLNDAYIHYIINNKMDVYLAIESEINNNKDLVAELTSNKGCESQLAIELTQLFCNGFFVSGLQQIVNTNIIKIYKLTTDSKKPKINVHNLIVQALQNVCKINFPIQKSNSTVMIGGTCKRKVFLLHTKSGKTIQMVRHRGFIVPLKYLKLKSH